MAVICVSLADQDGRVVAPQVGIVEPSPDSWDPNTSLEETMEECQFTEISEQHALSTTGEGVNAFMLQCWASPHTYTAGRILYTTNFTVLAIKPVVLSEQTELC